MQVLVVGKVSEAGSLVVYNLRILDFMPELLIVQSLNQCLASDFVALRDLLKTIEEVDAALLCSQVDVLQI